MKKPQSELSKIFLEKLEELTAAHELQMITLVAGHEAQQKKHQEFFARQQQQWEQKVSELFTQVQGLETQLQGLSKSLKPLTEQLKSLATLSDSLRNS